MMVHINKDQDQKRNAKGAKLRKDIYKISVIASEERTWQSPESARILKQHDHKQLSRRGAVDAEKIKIKSRTETVPKGRKGFRCVSSNCQLSIVH